ncbi:MAG: Uncharacterized protein FD146_74 [Anaerolineaceae bacterium]|nr:MAG: Uncharacterized protein FD146_74 [Anaerolineaceae bacterium]
MTWVIGRAGPFGYAVGLSDVRVTLSDGTERDCLQKIYNIGPHLAIGFAGSVRIGFEVINQLSAALRPPQQGMAWIPQVFAENLPQDTKELFRAFPEVERRLGLQLLLLSAHPTENDGDAPWAKCYVYRFSAPEFEPKIAHPAQIVSIGSGSKVNNYMNALHKLDDDFDLFQLQVGSRDGAALGLMMSISNELKKFPVQGISDHLHICTVGRDGIRIGKNDIQTYGTVENRFTMPPVATNLEELRFLLANTTKTSIDQARC